MFAIGRQEKDVDEKIEFLYTLRPDVMKALEDKRRDGLIGSSLEAKLIFRTASDRDFAALQSRREQLPAIFIVSQADVVKVAQVEKGLGENFPQTEIVVEKADGQKCPRCWNYRMDIGQDKDHPSVCQRCATNVKEILSRERKD